MLVICSASCTHSWEGFTLKSLAFMRLLRNLLYSSHDKSSPFDWREILLMDFPSSFDSTIKDGLLGKGFPKLSSWINSTLMAWEAIQVMEHKEFTSSVVFHLTIRKVIWDLLSLVAHYLLSFRSTRNKRMVNCDLPQVAKFSQTINKPVWTDCSWLGRK